jgi:AI-2 transport protein TqsA
VRKSDYSKINNFCLIFLTGFAMTATLSFMKPALVPLVFSFFLYGIISSLIRWTSGRLKINKTIATILVFAFLLLAIVELIGMVLDSVSLLMVNIDQYKDQVIGLLKTITAKVPIQAFHLDMEMFLDQLRIMPYFSYARSFTSGIITVVGNLFLILTFLFFFLLGEKKSDLTNPMLKNILVKVTAYVSIKFFTSLLSGLLVGILLFSFNINMFMLFAFFTIILNFIPNVGATIATLLPLPIILFQYGAGWQMVTMLSVMTMIHLFIGNFLDPKIMGENLDLHPVTILVFLIFWGLVWGIPGLFLAVPITCILKIVLSRIDNTRTIAEILGGRLPR